jgi:hypothetical protein
MKIPILPILPILLGGLLCAAANAQILINEVMSSNSSAFSDENGDFEDWVELYNAGTTEVNLHGYGLSDNPSNPFKWTFGSTTLGAGKFLIVWASGKNRQAGTPQPGILREVYSNIPGSNLASLLDHWSFPSNPTESSTVTTLFEAPTNAADNYGQRMSAWLVPPQTGNYRFWIASDDEGRLSLSTNENRANAVTIASVPGWTNSREWTKFPQQQSADIFLQAGQRYYIEALMKEGAGGDNLAVGWSRPDGVQQRPIPGSHFISGISETHTNFSISAAGEPLQLTAPGGEVVDAVPAVALPRDVSYGRSPTNRQVWQYFSNSTPGAPNGTDGFTEILWDTPGYSAEAGFYTTNFDLHLQAAAPGQTILYTLDGSIPDPANLNGKTYSYKNSYPRNSTDPIGPLLTGSIRTLTYSSPIPIRNRTSDPNRLSLRNTTFDTNTSGYAPTTPVFKGTIVRSRLVKNGAMPGPVASRSYFVTPEGAARYALPVISISADENVFFDHFEGNYTAGRDFEAWRASTTAGANGGSPANYTRRGEYSERPLHLEVFTPGAQQPFSQSLGFRMHGGWSRANPQKSLRLYAKSRYDEANTMNHPFIPGLTGNATGEPITSFRRIALRNSGNDNTRTRIHDAFIQRVVKPLGVDQLGYQPAVHFINGEYWGTINIRERSDRYFIASHHGIPPEDIAMLSNDAQVSEGTQKDREDFIALRNFIAANSMANPANYAIAESQMDMLNFILYNVSQIYANNRDWPHNNIDFWRSNKPGPGPTNDGRWRWVIFDTDFGFGHSGDHTTNTLLHATNTANDWSKVKLRKLLENPGFRNTFINAFADHMSATFRSARVNAVVDEMAATIAPYMPEHAQRWRNQGSTSTDYIKAFGQGRPASMRQHLSSYFGLSGDASVTLNVSGRSGHLAINTLTLKPGTPGLPNPAAPFPWTGIYFRGVPVTVTAIPEPGHRFIGWQQYPTHSGSTITLDPTGGIQLTARFEEIPANELPQLVHHWDFETGPLSQPAQTTGGGLLTINPGPGTEALLNEATQGFESTHLRLNSPVGATLELALPTRNYRDVSLEFLSRRSTSGAAIQTLSYTTNGSTWTSLPGSTVAAADPQRFSYDFSKIPGTSDNPNFAVRITFAAGEGGTTGNNRFDDLSLIGTLVAEPNFPPRVSSAAVPPDGSTLRAGQPPVSLTLGEMFEDPENKPLSFSTSSSQPTIVRAEISSGNLLLSGLAAGESSITVTADDGHNLPVHTTFRLLVHPAAHVLAGGDYQFHGWASDSPALTYPAHMLFLQSEVDDPLLDTPLARAYAIPADDAAAPQDVDFPYAASSRSRINGLGPAGVSFITTGRNRAPGGALLALDTRGLAAATVAFTGGTVAPGTRNYAVRLQYRVGGDGPFLDLLDETKAQVEYLRSPTAGHSQPVGPVSLPAAAMNQPYIQLLWRYHHLGGGEGPRDEMRLADIQIVRTPGGFLAWQQDQFNNPADLADPSVSGPYADPLRLGVNNLMRYALGIDQPADMAGAMPECVISSGNIMTFRFPYDPEKSDIAYVVEASPDLADWGTILFDSRTGSSPVTRAGWLEIPDTTPGAQLRFFRLKVLMLSDE